MVVYITPSSNKSETKFRKTQCHGIRVLCDGTPAVAHCGNSVIWVQRIAEGLVLKSQCKHKHDKMESLLGGIPFLSWADHQSLPSEGRSCSLFLQSLRSNFHGFGGIPILSFGSSSI